MRRELALYCGGRYVSNWPVVLLIGLVVGLFAGLVYATLRYLLRGEFSFVSILFAMILSTGFFAGLSIRKCYVMQPEYAAANRRTRR